MPSAVLNFSLVNFEDSEVEDSILMIGYQDKLGLFACKYDTNEN